MKLLIWVAFLFILPLASTIAQVHDAVLTDHKTYCSLQKGGLLVEEAFSIQINNRDGERFTRIRIPFSSREKALKIQGHISDKYGKTVRILKKSDIIEKSNFGDESLFEDSFIKEFTLKYNEYPYIIHYSTTIFYREYVHIANWLPVIHFNIPTIKSSLQIDIPKDFQINIFDQQTESFRKDSLKNNYIYKWTASYNGKLENEIFSPPLIECFPHVWVVAHNFLYGIPGSAATWQDYGNWHYRLNDKLSDLPHSEKKIIDGIISDKEDEQSKIKALYQYVQENTRYINVSVNTGRLKPYPASYVAHNKFGDCKALSVYLMSILEYAGIPSYYTLINAGDPIVTIKKSLPAQQFNHVILCIPLDTNELFLDATSDMPFGYTGTFIQNRDVLIVRPDDSYFLTTPALSPENVTEFRHYTIKSDVNMPASIRMEVLYRGKKYEILHYYARSLEEHARHRRINDYFIPAGYLAEKHKLDYTCPDIPEIKLSCDLKSNRPSTTYGDELYLDLIPFPMPGYTEPSVRTMPVQLDWPIHFIDTAVYLFPTGYDCKDVISSDTLDCPFGFFKINSVISGNQILVTKSILLQPGIYKDDDYKELVAFIRKVIDFERTKKIILHRKN